MVKALVKALKFLAFRLIEPLVLSKVVYRTSERSGMQHSHLLCPNLEFLFLLLKLPGFFHTDVQVRQNTG